MALSMRSFLNQLKERHMLFQVEKTVHPRHELGIFLKKTKGEKGIFFPRVEGYSMPVVGGLTGNRDHLAIACRTTRDKLTETIMTAITQPGSTCLAAGGPVQERVVLQNIDLKRLLPVPTFHEKDSAPFVTAGIVMVKDPLYGRRFTSIRRMQLNGPDELSILIESPGLLEQYYEEERRGKPLEMAIIIGVHPAVALASQLSTQTFGLDKMNLAAALAGETIPMVRCRTVDLEVPAEAEIVLEGHMLPQTRQPEGPFGELMGYYGPQTLQPIVRVTAVTHREEPIFWTIFPGSYEHKLPNAVMREVVLLNHVRHVVPSVKKVHITMAGGGRCHAVIAIDKKAEGQGKQAIFAAFASNKDVKHVVVVNDDVDIFDPEEVEWAIATRVQADQDVIVVPGAQGTPLEPSHNVRGVSAKLGIDATYPLSHQEIFRRTKIPGYDDISLGEYLSADWQVK